MKKWNLRNKIGTIFLATLMIFMIALIYTGQLNKTVSDNTIQNITELAEHDQNNIHYYIESTWNELEYIKGKFSSYQCNTIEEIEAQMNVECANSMFSHIYLVGEDGKIYTDKFLTYDPKKVGQSGRVDLLPFFDNEEDYIVGRFDDKVEVVGLTKESILYGIRLKDFEVEGISMIGLVGISNIGNIQDRLTINSFMKDGVSRGYSAVVDQDGNYIVNVEQTVYVEEQENFFDKINNSQQSDLTSEEISQKIENGETFHFYYTEEGVDRIVYCMPFEENGIPWYFLSSVESTVFTDQNHAFFNMSMVMLICVLLVLIIVLILVSRSRDQVITINAEAKARSAFLANMSHEIRTPLNGIIGLIFLMEKDLDSKLEVEKKKALIRQRLSKMEETAQYLLSLINNILDISKLQEGKVELKNDIISPELIAESIWSMQKNTIESQGITLLMEREIIEPWIIGDDLVIKQVLMNILSNAAKFTPDGGSITLKVQQKLERNGKVATIFTCRDTGCGMSEEFLEHIWDSFSQERRQNHDSIKGTGLGMAISKLLVDAMGGEIQVESKIGKGSLFTVTLHSIISKEAPDYRKNRMEGLTLEEEGHRETILLAEDNELNAEILIEILESEGFSVLHAEDGQEAVDLFRQSAEGEIGIILMDMQMPVLDGCSATSQIRSLDRADAKSVSIFACTANNFNEDRERAKESGMDDFLSKPVDVKQLLKKLGRS